MILMVVKVMVDVMAVMPSLAITTIGAISTMPTMTVNNYDEHEYLTTTDDPPMMMATLAVQKQGSCYMQVSNPRSMALASCEFRLPATGAVTDETWLLVHS